MRKSQHSLDNTFQIPTLTKIVSKACSNKTSSTRIDRQNCTGRTRLQQIIIANEQHLKLQISLVCT